MPRLNNQDELVIETYDLTVHWDDPGQDPPVDLCDECAASWLDADLWRTCVEMRPHRYYDLPATMTRPTKLPWKSRSCRDAMLARQCRPEQSRGEMGTDR